MSEVVPKLFRINTGSCNGCDVEFMPTILVEKFGVSTLGVEMVEDIKDANIIAITGH